MASFGWKASAEQFGPVALLDFARLAQEQGFDTIAISDHFQPWRHSDGHAPFAPAWLGAAGASTTTARLGTSVLTPTLRYHPSVIAQAFATLGVLFPGRVFLGVGSGESLNEVPATAAPWPAGRERRERLAEAVELIRALWSQERLSFAGRYYQTRLATIYDRPAEPIPIYIAASGPLAATLVGRVGDGFICTSGKQRELYQQLLDAVAQGADASGRDPDAIRRMIEIKVSYDTDRDRALADCGWWAALALSGDAKTGVDDAMEMERRAETAKADAHRRFIVSDDPKEVADAIGFYLDLGFNELVFHAPGPDQARFLQLFSRDVLPVLRRRVA